MAEKKVGDISFGTMIAFLAPGFVGYVGLSYQLPAIANWLDAAQRSDQTVGVFLFSALASASIGVILSGVRDILLDWLVRRGFLGLAAEIVLPTAGFAKLTDDKKLAAFEAVIENYYRYYQFYANMAVAILVLSLSRWLAPAAPEWPWWWPIGVVVILIFLITSAYGSLRRYANAATEILQ